MKAHFAIQGQTLDKIDIFKEFGINISAKEILLLFAGINQIKREKMGKPEKPGSKSHPMTTGQKAIMFSILGALIITAGGVIASFGFLAALGYAATAAICGASIIVCTLMGAALPGAIGEQIYGPTKPLPHHRKAAAICAVAGACFGALVAQKIVVNFYGSETPAPAKQTSYEPMNASRLVIAARGGNMRA